jgi:peptide/nickel transport system substrate-binding protein
MVQANPVDQDLVALVFDSLTTLDVTGQVSPSLALDWDVSQDGRVYEFRLRPDVRWQDGAPFTAADVAFTVQAMQDPGFQGDPSLRELWRSVTVETPDSHTVRFSLQEPFPSFLLYTTIGILPAHLLSTVPAADLPGHEFSTQKPVGTGRFMVESVSPEEVVLAANPNYWGAKPYLERIALWFYDDWNGLLADYKDGRLNGFAVPGPQDMATVAAMPSLDLYSAPAASYSMVYLNLARDTLPAFKQKEVRQALLYALDRQQLIDRAIFGQGLIADSPLPPYTWAFDPSVRRYRYDPERAVGLLDASGWMDSDGDRIRDKDGVELSFTLLTPDDPLIAELAQEIARQWSSVGVVAKIQQETDETITNLVRSRDYDAALIDIRLTADPDPYPLWHSTQVESGQNFSGFANEDADLVMEQERLTSDPKQRLQLLHTFQQIFAEEVPTLLLYYPIYVYAVDHQVRDVQISPMLHASDRFRNVEDWYLEREEAVVNEAQEFDKNEQQ